MVTLDPVPITSDPTTGAPAAAAVQFPAASDPPQQARLQNESPYALKVTISGYRDWLGAWQSAVFPVPSDASSIQLTPALIAGPQAAPSSCVLVTLAYAGDQLDSTPFALARQQSSFSLQRQLGGFDVAPGATGTQRYMVDQGAHAISLVVYGAGESPGLVNLTTAKVQGVLTGFKYIDYESWQGTPLWLDSTFSPVDTQLDVTVTADASNTSPAHVVLMEVLDDSIVEVANAAVPLQVVQGDKPTATVIIGGNPAANTPVQLLAPTTLGQRIFLHAVQLNISDGTGGWGYLQDTDGNSLAMWLSGQVFTFDFKGMPIPTGRGLRWIAAQNVTSSSGTIGYAIA